MVTLGGYVARAVSASGAPPLDPPDWPDPSVSTVGELVGWSGGVPLGADPSEGGPMHWPMAVCSSGCGCLAFSSSYNCSPNTPIRQLLRVGSLVVKGLSNPGPDPGSEASGANVVLAGRVPGVGRVGVGGEVVDVAGGGKGRCRKGGHRRGCCRRCPGGRGGRSRRGARGHRRGQRGGGRTNRRS